MKKKRIYNNNIKGLRELRGLSLASASELMEISRVHLFNIENGSDRASAKLINKIKEVYKPTEDEWQLYFATFTKNQKTAPLGASSTGDNKKTENTQNDSKVSIFTDGKEVEIEFIWIPRNKVRS